MRLAFQYVARRTVITTCSTQPGCLIRGARGPRRSGTSAARPPRRYAACQRKRLARLQRPSASAAPRPSSRRMRSSRARSRTVARSSCGATPSGGRPPRVARNRNPGPSWYVWRCQRRCGSRMWSLCSARIGSGSALPPRSPGASIGRSLRMTSRQSQRPLGTSPSRRSERNAPQPPTHTEIGDQAGGDAFDGWPARAVKHSVSRIATGTSRAGPRWSGDGTGPKRCRGPAPGSYLIPKKISDGRAVWPEACQNRPMDRPR